MINASTDVIRMRAVYEGQVQGVGFRATTLQLAQDRAVTGFVRNCEDGTVELEVQGARSDVQALLDAIQHEFGDSIRSIDFKESGSVTSEEQVFEIRY